VRCALGRAARALPKFQYQSGGERGDVAGTGTEDTSLGRVSTRLWATNQHGVEFAGTTTASARARNPLKSMGAETETSVALSLPQGGNSAQSPGEKTDSSKDATKTDERLTSDGTPSPTPSRNEETWRIYHFPASRSCAGQGRAEGCQEAA
jgi:hypothetical protein